MFRIFERPASEFSGFDFSQYTNSMWLVVLTMTTVGYGDLYPFTILGRATAVVLCL